MLGSGLIVAFYLAMNLIYLKASTPSEMAGVHDVGRLAAMKLFGDSVGTLFTGGIILLLISTCSAITFVGPRVIVAMSNRGQTPSLFGRLNSRGAPSKALWIQATCMISFVWLVDIDSLFQYVGLLLSGCAVFTIYCAIRFRRREPHAPRPFQMPFYPLPALVFMGFSIYTIVWSVQETPWPLVASGASIVAIGILRPLLRQSR
jgi:APA family basic amino acid/polyamine antiporter